MRKYALIISIILQLFICISFADTIEEASHAIGLIITYDKDGNAIGQGTGFFIDSNGTLITNLHVFGEAEKAIIKLDNGAFYEINEYLGLDKDMDILILKVAGKNLPAIKIGDSSLSKVGDEIIAIGNPQGLQNTVSKGTISAIRNEENLKIIQITAPVSPGSSGGPLLNTKGEVIGITTFIVDGQNLNFAIPIEYAKQVMASSDLKNLDKEILKKLDNSATYFFIAAVLSEDSGNRDSAIEYYKKAIEQDKMFKEAYYGLEDLYYKKGMYKEEVIINEKLADLFPKDHYTFHILGVSYEAVGKEKEAIEAYKKALLLKYDYADPLFNLGLLYILNNDVKNAKEQIKKLNPLNPHFANQLERLVNMLEKKAILYDDKKLIYVDQNENISKDNEFDTIIVNKPKNANFLVKGVRTKYGIWIDPKKWEFKKDSSNKYAEYSFSLKGEDAYAMIIPERIEFPIDNLKKLAINNAKESAQDVKVIKEGIRIVNGITLSYMEMEATLEGVKFTYMGNYYSDGNGSFQILGYTSRNLAEKYRKDIDELINGFTIIP